MSGFVHWLDSRQRRHPILGGPLAVLYKYFDDQGFYLSALIAFYAFLSLFPLFLLFSTILGFALENDPALRTQILESAARQIPVIGQQIETQQLRGSGTALAIAAGTALFGSLGVAQAIQNAMNVTWGVRRNERPNPVTSRLRSVGLLCVLGVFVVATTFISQVGAFLDSSLPWGRDTSGMFLVLGSFVLSAIAYVVICRFGTAQPPAVSDLLPGAILAASAWQVLQTGGSAFVTSVVARSSATNGVFAIVLGLIAWLYIGAICLVFCLETNIVYAKRLYPRSLLTPMTDRVDLTEADRAAYSRLARAQSLKGFQNVEVTFDHDGQYASAYRRRKAEERADVEVDEETPVTRILRLGGGLRRALPSSVDTHFDALADLVRKPFSGTLTDIATPDEEDGSPAAGERRAAAPADRTRPGPGTRPAGPGPAPRGDGASVDDADEPPTATAPSAAFGHEAPRDARGDLGRGTAVTSAVGSDERGEPRPAPTAGTPTSPLPSTPSPARGCARGTEVTPGVERARRRGGR
ncbi:YihY/virulence factor BrkB family protein [Mobilicoccus pelagius]|uniref:Putative ribonuclease BN n=1 Tax=Mobilicoccus pelagius NBRC 104925 TaxID=1089455 RepID=H5UUV8_9MICO|nr:YihY/virulence factor BrkB family protein [Mobilicoccus pelagius]GAB49516.1 putative ribonuclease BN [Mobilicoccus pelagius NBRC 104925]